MWIWDTRYLRRFFCANFLGDTGHAGEARTSALGGIRRACGPSEFSSILRFCPCFRSSLDGWSGKRDKESAPWVKHVAAALLVFAIGLVPWTIRNYRVFGKFIVLRSNFGLELWLGNNPDVTDTCRTWLHPNDNPEEAEKYKRMGEIAYMAEKQHEAFAFMRTHPLDTLDFMFRRFVRELAGRHRQSCGYLVVRPSLREGFHGHELPAFPYSCLSARCMPPARAIAKRSRLPGSSHLSAGFLSDTLFPALSFSHRSDHDGSCGRRAWRI